MAISKSLEIGEGYAPNIFSYTDEQLDGKNTPSVSNPHKLTPEEMMELADFNIRLWIELKENIRKYGLNSIKVFNSDDVK